MRKLTGFLSIALIGGTILASAPASADTVYHRVYRQSITATDPFSILDTRMNNALLPEDYKKGMYKGSFATVDSDNNGFISRSEFYGAKPTMASVNVIHDLFTPFRPSTYFGDKTEVETTRVTYNERDAVIPTRVSYTDRNGVVVSARDSYNDDVTTIAPAAGDTRRTTTVYRSTYRDYPQGDIVYRDDPCDNQANRNNTECR